MTKSVLLIQPNYNTKSDAKSWACNPPLGLLYLAAVLEKENIPVKIIDANVQNLTVNKTASLIKKSKAKYVGFSILTPAADWCSAVIKKLPPSLITIAGGPHPSGIPRQTLKDGYRIVVIGEGEETLKDICLEKKLADIKGIAYRNKNKVIITPPRLPLNPDRLPLPARHLIVNGGTNRPYASSGTRYFPWSPIITSRGCPYQCYFCNKNIFGSKFRPRSPENVIAEIDELVQIYGVKEIDFYDDNFNFDMARAEKIMGLIIQRKYKLCLRFSNGLRADKINKKLLHKMKRAGTEYIAYGVESGDQQILSQIPKGESLTQIKKATKLTREIGIPVTGFFVLGLLGDTKKTMQKTINFANNTGFDMIILNIAAPYPGTAMWQKIINQGGKIFINRWADFYNTSGKMLYSLPGMASREEVEKMYRKAHLSFYFRPKYMIAQIPKIFSPGYLPVIVKGLTRIIYSQLK